MDVLFPGIGEINGGSQREERFDLLKARMKEMNAPAEVIWWYLDTRASAWAWSASRYS